ncbi:retrovirus-related pol polyprotein from transposon TNT 1-94, partial [Trifolium medium]|nr:retrovirus-related pol polyprotein from transposon TNT 1-94 [Trifolium medium]
PPSHTSNPDHFITPDNTTDTVEAQLKPNTNQILPPAEAQPAPNHNQTPHLALRRSTRQITKPTHLSDYLCNHSSSSPKSSSSGTLYPLADYHSYANVSKSLATFAMSITTDVEPKDYKAASQLPCWVEAMNTELKALHQNKTWIYVDPPPNIKPIGSKWVYKVKHKAYGSVERYKASFSKILAFASDGCKQCFSPWRFA